MYVPDSYSWNTFNLLKTANYVVWQATIVVSVPSQTIT